MIASCNVRICTCANGTARDSYLKPREADLQHRPAIFVRKRAQLLAPLLAPWLALALAACATANASIVNEKNAELASSGPLAGSFGSGLDKKARDIALTTEYNALERGLAGASVKWKQSDTVFGSVTPQQLFRVGAMDCRRYVHNISISGEVRTASATACREDDGVWRPIS